MKILHISDMDGTLMTKKKEITAYSTRVINEFISRGGLFTVATARTSYGADYLLEGVDLNVPGIIMNGVALYDFRTGKYADVESIDQGLVANIERVLDRHGNTGFMYTYKNDRLSIFYKDPGNLQFSQYYNQRAIDACETVSQTGSYVDTGRDREVIYFALTGPEEEVEPIWRDLDQIEGVGTAFYLNVYNRLYCLEVFNARASKATALQKLKDMVQADQVVVFGDNYNDIPMMEVADRAYAPENAVDQVKEMVDRVIPSCDEDGVARFLQEAYDIEL